MKSQIEVNKINISMFLGFILFRIFGLDTFEAAVLILLFGIYWKL